MKKLIKRNQLKKGTQTFLEFVIATCVVLLVSSIDNLFEVKGYEIFALILMIISVICGLIIKKYGRKDYFDSLYENEE